MRRFDAEYLARTRRGLWDGPREALSLLDLPARERVLDVGCGTGELTRVLREETDGTVLGCDADRELLQHVDGPRTVADAYRLPFAENAVDLVVCQALLINLAAPARALAEFARVASDHVAVIEPDNGAVTVESTVPIETELARQAREHYLAGVDTDVTLGSDLERVLTDAGLSPTTVARHDHRRTIDPPYDEAAVDATRRKVTGEDLARDRETLLAGGLSPVEYDRLREQWREMGRTVAAQMDDGSYKRTETVPFHVAVGAV